MIKILGIAGSLRNGSFNKAILRAAAELVPEDAQVEIFDLEGIPVFNQDLEANPPQRVRELKGMIKAADAILLSTPEYNNSVPGVLKNAIDWASRPYGDNAWHGKTVGIMSALGGMLGAAKAQYHLRQSLVFLDVKTLKRPEVIVTFANQKINDGKLVDEETRQKIRQLVEALVALAQSADKKA